MRNHDGIHEAGLVIAAAISIGVLFGIVIWYLSERIDHPDEHLLRTRDQIQPLNIGVIIISVLLIGLSIKGFITAVDRRSIDDSINEIYNLIFAGYLGISFLLLAINVVINRRRIRKPPILTSPPQSDPSEQT